MPQTHTYYAELTGQANRRVLLRYSTYANLRRDLNRVTALRSRGTHVRLTRIPRDSADNVYKQRWRSADGIRPDNSTFSYDCFWRMP